MRPLASLRGQPHNRAKCGPVSEPEAGRSIHPSPGVAMTVPPDRETMNLPVLPLRDVVVFPHMVIPLFVGRDKSIRALDQAMEADKRILLVAQKTADTD